MKGADGAGDGDRAHEGQRHAPARPSSARYAPGIAARFILQRGRERDCSARLSPGQAARFIVFERYRDADAALEHFANIGHLMAPLTETASVTGELLGTPNDQIRRNLTGDQPKLYEPWIALSDE